jgi:hypothetical protein
MPEALQEPGVQASREGQVVVVSSQKPPSPQLNWCSTPPEQESAGQSASPEQHVWPLPIQ